MSLSAFADSPDALLKAHMKNSHKHCENRPPQC